MKERSIIEKPLGSWVEMAWYEIALTPDTIKRLEAQDTFDTDGVFLFHWRDPKNYYVNEHNVEDTNLPAPCLTVELESVKYGPTMNGADQWSSLGPVKLTDFIYLDDDLMILRGNVNTNSLFVWKRIVV